MKKRWYALPICILVVAIALFYQVYHHQVSQIVYDESVSQLKGIYTQVGKTYYTFVSNNWKFLEAWSQYIDEASLDDATSDDDIAAYMENKKETWGIEDFYFLDDDGCYMTIDGRTGTLDLANRFDYLLTENEPIVLDGTFEDGTILTIFAIPAENTDYLGDFEYCAFACSYTNEYILDTLAIDAFSGEADCYIINGDDGWVLFSSENSNKEIGYLQDYMSKSDNFTDEQVAQIVDGLANQTEGSLEFTRDGQQCYMIYMPIGFRNWMMVGTVPRSVVSAHFDQIQTLTAILLLAICACIAILIIALIIRGSRKQLGSKALDLLYREQLFDILTNSVDDVFLMFSRSCMNGHYKVDYVSPTIERLLGISATEVKEDIHTLGHVYQASQAPFMMQHPEDIDLIPFDDCMQGETQLANQQTGERRWYSETLYHVQITETERFVFVLSDRTNEKSKNEALTEALDIAESANEAKSNFLFNMSHDIRTPMNAIVGYSTLLAKDADQPEKVRAYTRKISASSQHLLSLINDILDMSKIESGKTRLNMAEFNLSDLLSELEVVLMPQARAHSQKFEIRTHSLKKEVLFGDKTRLSQILINLLSNAIKYTQDGGNILLEITDHSRETDRFAKLCFVVQDNGMGMSQEFLKTVYDPFVRARSTTVSKIQGTGLGLAITKNLVELMGGTIAVESELDHGTTFTVNIDFRVANQELDPDFWAHHDITRVLAVDDEEDVCKNICELMDGTGVDVSYATDGATAVQMVSDATDKGEEYSMVLLDWKMPGMDGIETTRRIRERVGNDVPIFVLTAYDWEDIEQEAREAGIDAFLPKPFFVSGLQNTIRQLDAENDDAQAAEEASIAGVSFLVAEDNEINAELLEELLEDEGATCDLAVNGQEAVDKFLKAESGTYDVILMDVQMPVMDGYEATRAIRASEHPEAKTIPIAAMTANAFAEDVANAHEAGMDAHLAKPIDMRLVKATVAGLLKERGKL